MAPKILTMAETATIFSEALQKTIIYVPIDTGTFVDIVKKFMNPDPYFIQHISSLGEDLKEGRAAGMNDLVETLSGEKPMNMRDYVIRNKAAFA